MCSWGFPDLSKNIDNPGMRHRFFGRPCRGLVYTMISKYDINISAYDIIVLVLRVYDIVV